MGEIATTDDAQVYVDGAGVGVVLSVHENDQAAITLTAEQARIVAQALLDEAQKVDGAS